MDGVLGVDLLDKIGVTLDLKRQIALLGKEPANPNVTYANVADSMCSCGTAEGNDEALDNRCVLEQS